MRRGKLTRKVLFIRVSVFIFVLFSILTIRSLWIVYEKNKVVRERHTGLEEEITNLKGRKASLEEEIGRLGTERGLEEEIRTKFQVARPGEETVILVESEQATSSEKKGFWDTIKSLFE